MEIDRRQFFLAIGAIGAAGLLGGELAGCAPAVSIAAGRHTLMGLWDAVVPGTWNGVVQDRLADGTPAPGANDAGVMEWIEANLGSFPAPLDYLTDWFLRAWSADLDLWADVFHWPVDQSPTFGDLPLGPTQAESGRQYKIMLMQALFRPIFEPLDLKYFLGVTLAKAAFYGDFRAEQLGGERVGSTYIGFAGPNGPGPVADFTYNRPFGNHEARLTSTPGGLVMVP